MGYAAPGSGAAARFCRKFMAAKSTNISRIAHRVGREERWRANGHKGGVLWFTGLSGAGKTTLALELERRLCEKGWNAYVLDGDNVRYGLSADLGFSPDDRAENIRRVGEAAALFADAGLIVIAAFISPYHRDRRLAGKAAEVQSESGGGALGFHEIHIKADLETCEQRDPKGLYAKARHGEIADFTGISAPYEEPTAAHLVVDTQGSSVAESADMLVAYAERVFALG